MHLDLENKNKQKYKQTDKQQEIKALKALNKKLKNEAIGKLSFYSKTFL